jgi:putative transposase
LEGKERHAIARLLAKERNFSGEDFWARGYAVSTVGFELEQVRQYIREQEAAGVTANSELSIKARNARRLNPWLDRL